VRPLDPRLLRQVEEARAALVTDVVLGVLVTVAVVAQAVLFASVVSGAFDGRSPASMSGAIALLAAVVVARAALSGAFEATGRRAAAAVMSRLRLSLVERRLGVGHLATEGTEAGEVAAAAVQGVSALEAYFARYLPQVVLAVLCPAVVLVWTAVVDPTSAAIMVLTLPLIPMFMVLIGRFTEARTRARWRALARLSNHFLDVVRGLPTLRAFNRATVQAERIEATSDEYRATTMEVLRVSFLSGAVLELMATIGTALVAVTLGIRLIDGGIGLRAALTVLILTPELYAPLRALAAQFHASADGLAAAERILDLIGDPEPAASGTAAPPSWDAVRLEGVSVAGRAGPVLDGFDLEIRRGEVVALVGPSGAGKSTAASLLLGRRPDAGAVLVDGVEVATTEEGWRRQVAWLPQRPTMFRGSVRDNIALGEPAASDEQVAAAARLAGADAFVRDMRRGYDTQIGDGARGLSAGEARRIGLARALVRNCSLLVLDEPTANLDADSAEVIADSIRRLAPGRAVLLIEHRPELASLADRVVRIEDGHAVEDADHLVLR
jgi:thiol reductant ABC exporter CydD subunit